MRRFADYDVLVLVSLVWFLGKFVRYSFPPLFEPVQTAYGIGTATIGSAFTGFMLVYALMQFPSGVAADRIGSVRVVVAGATIAGIGALAVVLDSSFALLVAAMLVIGAGTGVHKTVAVRLVAREYPARTGRALGVHDTLGAFGGVAAPTAATVFLSTPLWLAPFLALAGLSGAGWRGMFLISAVAAFALAAAFGLRFRGRPSDGTDVLEEDKSHDGGSEDVESHDERRDTQRDGDEPRPDVLAYFALLRDGRFAAFVLVAIGVSFAHNGLAAFLPLYLSRVSGVTTATASLLYSVFFWTTFVQLVTGESSDRVGRLPVMVVAGGVATAGLWGIVLAPDAGPVTLGALIAVVGVGAQGFTPVRAAYLMELLPERLAGGGLGVVRTLLMGVGAFAPGTVGIVADAFDFRVAFGMLATVLAVATIGAVGLWATGS
ncbi:hypothetical protein JCM31271_33470 [Halorubrum trueperi]